MLHTGQIAQGLKMYQVIRIRSNLKWYQKCFGGILRLLSAKLFLIPYLKFIDEILYLVVEFGVIRTYMYVWVTCAEILVFKIIYMHNYSKISAMDEYFLTNFVTFFNILIIFIFSMIRICLREHLRTRTYHWNFAEPFEVYRRIIFP